MVVICHKLEPNRLPVIGNEEYNGREGPENHREIDEAPHSIEWCFQDEGTFRTVLTLQEFKQRQTNGVANNNFSTPLRLSFSSLVSGAM